jgi:hypothetical protein
VAGIVPAGGGFVGVIDGITVPVGLEGIVGLVAGNPVPVGVTVIDGKLDGETVAVFEAVLVIISVADTVGVSINDGVPVLTVVAVGVLALWVPDVEVGVAFSEEFLGAWVGFGVAEGISGKIGQGLGVFPGCEVGSSVIRMGGKLVGQDVLTSSGKVVDIGSSVDVAARFSSTELDSRPIPGVTVGTGVIMLIATAVARLGIFNACGSRSNRTSTIKSNPIFWKLNPE